jgi:hypothetical protein
MSELAQAMHLLRNLGLHVIKYPSGKYGFVGRVPAVLAYVHEDGSAPTDSECKDILQSCRPALVCKRYGIRTRTFETEQQALFAAVRAGFEAQPTRGEQHE